ncbi:MAG: spore gernimation protein, partial [Clostridia bacterium]|nr:spore gernimation protein [Clostridia bacterium]
AVNLASKVGAQIFFDEKSQCPYYNYLDGKTEHIVWFDDAKSIQKKLELSSNNNLYGVSYWNLMQWFPQNWLVLNQLYEIEKVI